MSANCGPIQCKDRLDRRRRVTGRIIHRFVAPADDFAFPPGAFGQVALHKVMTGWTAGVGVEVAVAPNWTVKVEGLYADLGSVTGTSVVTNPLFLGGDTFTASAHVRNSIVRVGFNYKFGS
jgi:outer membrane immunogenic protein